MFLKTANLSQIDEFDAIIDVRTPSEFAEDHIPGAINCPVLSDEERITVGTLYKQKSPFDARKVGGVLVARNIAHHLESSFSDFPKSWRPLIYCWRGGQRSGAMSIVLSQVGWSAHKLDGGYKTYRQNVLEQLASLPQQFSLRVICGATGSGKSRLLTALAEQGEQVIDLENLAQHRGSVLGKLPGHAQPSQKWFESLLLQVLQKFDSDKPVYIEAESNKIGRINLPDTLVKNMHESTCLLLETPLAVRIAGLLQDYDHYLTHPETLIEHLEFLKRFHGNKRLEDWITLINHGNFSDLVAELLTLHYDPSYYRATSQHYTQLNQAQIIRLDNLSQDRLCEIVTLLTAS